MARKPYILIAQAKDAAIAAATKRGQYNTEFERRVKGLSDDYKPEVSARKTAEARMERDAAISASEAESEQFITEIFEELESGLKAVAAEPVPDGFWNTVELIDKADLTEAERDIMLEPYRNNFAAYRYIGTHYRNTDLAAYDPDAPRYSYDDVIERASQLKAGFLRAAKGTDRVFSALMERDGYTQAASEVFNQFIDHNFFEAGRLLKRTNVHGK